MQFKILTLYLVLVTEINSLNLKNNACQHYYDYPFWFISENCHYNEDFDLTTSELLQKYGYQFKNYDVSTADGYILTMYRIFSKNRNKSSQPVFLMHGLATNCLLYLRNGNNSLAFIIADAGYDVWLPNLRGTIFSKHKTYNTSDPRFWEYSLDDLAKYDVADQLKFVAKETRKSGSVIYIGHSQGTTLIFMLASENKGIQKILKGILALSPIVYIDGLPKLDFIIKIGPFLLKIMDLLRVKGLQVKNLKHVLLYICRFKPYFCLKLTEIFAGKWSKKFLADNLLEFFSTFPESVSVRQLKHYTQIGTTGNFQKFDFGREKNMLAYAQETPPTYSLATIKIPVYMFYGESDVGASKKNADKILKELGSREKFLIKAPINDKNFEFNQIDFLVGRYLRELLYDALLKIMSEKLKA